MSLFWNSTNHISIGDAIDQATSAAEHSFPTNEDHSGTDERVDQLLLVCAAMWELICEKTNLTEQDLVNRVAVLDAKDGVADSKLTQTPRKCPKCNRVVTPRHERCLYCGFQLPSEGVFKTI